MNNRELTIKEIRKLEGFENEIEVDRKAPLSVWYAEIMNEKLKDLTDGSLARLLRQNLHLKYAVSEAILRLLINPISGKLYEGELINSINSVNSEFWRSNSEMCNEVNALLLKIANKQISFPEQFEWYSEKAEQEFYEEVLKVISALNTYISN